jgi:TrmH family RNA methyltransferase
MTVEHITSPANALLKDIRKAQEKGSVTSDGRLIAEGPHLVEEAARSGLRIACVIVSEGVKLPHGLRADRVVEVPERLFGGIAGTETPQGILALAEPPRHSMDDVWRAGGLVVVLDAVRDPGNAGAIARSAEAFGASGMVFYGDAVNPLHPKTIRSSAGSLFRIPFVRCARGVEMPESVGLFAGVGNASARAVWDCDFRGACGIVIGNEGGGVGEMLLARAKAVRIPTRGVESLNAAVAAGILLYEAARQRRVT